MNISGVRPYAGFYHYNSTKLAQLHSQRIAVVEEAGRKAEEQRQTASVQEKQMTAQQESQQNFDAFDYAQQYQQNDFELKGKDSDISILDAQKAISDLDKDQALQQYQFFVGTGNSEEGSLVAKGKNPAGMNVRSPENFVL